MPEIHSREQEVSREDLIREGAAQVAKAVSRTFQDGITISNETTCRVEDGVVVITFPADMDMRLHKEHLESAAKNWAAAVKASMNEYEGDPTAKHLYTGDGAEMVADLIEKNGVKIEGGTYSSPKKDDRY